MGVPFSYQVSDAVLRRLHSVDQNASGRISVADTDALRSPQTRERYLFSSLLEEAITSSQLEGAATTREQAKEMIRKNRPPRDRGERMILNNFRAMEMIRDLTDQPLTPDLVRTIHSTVTDGTLDDDVEPPFVRVPGDGVAVFDAENQLLHRPPPAEEIPARLVAMCEFANSRSEQTFTHPVIRAILLHFWLAYDHPFVDGNGRTARALFYWSMLRDEYWLAEYISISRIIKRAPTRYALSFLYAETDDCDATYFIDSQLIVLESAIADLHEYLDRKTKELQRTTKLLRATDCLNHRQVALIGHALRHPGTDYTIASHQTSHKVTYETARTDLLDLADKNLLEKLRLGKAYHFRPVADLEDRLRGLDPKA